MNTNYVIGLKFKADEGVENFRPFKMNDVLTIRQKKGDNIYYSINRERQIYIIEEKELKEMIENDLIRSI